MPANQLLRTGDTLAKMSGLRKPGTAELGNWGGPVITAGGNLTVAHLLSKSDPITRPSRSRVHRELNFQVAASELFSDLPPTLGG